MTTQKKKINYIKHIFQSIFDVVQIDIFKGLSRHSECFFFIHCEYFKTETYVVEQKTCDILIFATNSPYLRTILCSSFFLNLLF